MHQAARNQQLISSSRIYELGGMTTLILISALGRDAHLTMDY